MKEIILASASPRRSELMRQIGLDFRALPADIAENINLTVRPEELVQNLSYAKALYVTEQVRNGAIVIGADTLVFSDEILGKPKSREEAYRMLKSLQGGWHEVITGITVVDSEGLRFKTDYEKTRVKMKTLSDDIINAYINTGEPMDKAGAYGIQGIGAVLIEKIEGCYFNVVGLPLSKLSVVLAEFGIFIL